MFSFLIRHQPLRDGRPFILQASVSIEVGRRIYRRAVDANLKVAMAAGGAPGGTGLGDGLPLIDLVARRDQQAGIVSVIGLLAVAMVDDDQVAITAPCTPQR